MDDEYTSHIEILKKWTNSGNQTEDQGEEGDQIETPEILEKLSLYPE